MSLLLKHFSLSSAEKVLYDFAYRLGVPMSYEGERDGRVIHDIHPIVSPNTINTSLGINRIGLHTEMAFHRIRPSYVLLFCMRNQHTETFVVSMDTVLSHLSVSTKRILSEAFFKIDPPRSYTKPYLSNWKPILEKNTLVLAEHCDIHFENSLAEEAYQKTIRVANQHIQSICLTPGDLLILDNRKVLHGRKEILNNPHRWLKRMYVRESV